MPSFNREHLRHCVQQAIEFIRAKTDTLNAILADHNDNSVSIVDRVSRALRGAVGKVDGTARLKVCVLALIKAGKTTLFNSLIGADVLPYADTVATGGICIVRHCADGTTRLYKPLADTGVEFGCEYAQGELIADGVDACRAAIALNNDGARTEGAAFAPVLLLYTPIAAFEHLSADQAALIDLVDTPGQDEPNPIVARVVASVLCTVDVLLFVVNYTSMRCNGEQTLWQLVNTTRPDLFAHNAKRIVVALNKFDQQGANGLEIDKARAYVQESVRQYTGATLPTTRIWPTMARQMFYARLAQRGLLNDGTDKARMLLTLAFGPLQAKRRTLRDVAPAVLDELMQDSFVPALERDMITTLTGEALELLATACASDATRALAELHDACNVALALRTRSHDDLQRQRDALVAAFAAAQQFVDKRVGEWRAALIAEIGALWRAMCASLRASASASVTLPLAAASEFDSASAAEQHAALVQRSVHAALVGAASGVKQRFAAQVEAALTASAAALSAIGAELSATLRDVGIAGVAIPVAVRTDGALLERVRQALVSELQVGAGQIHIAARTLPPVVVGQRIVRHERRVIGKRPVFEWRTSRFLGLFVTGHQWVHVRDEDITVEVPVFEDVTRTDVKHAVDAAGIAASCQQEALRAVAALEASFGTDMTPMLEALAAHTAASLMTPVRDAVALIEAALRAQAESATRLARETNALIAMVAALTELRHELDAATTNHADANDCTSSPPNDSLML